MNKKLTVLSLAALCAASVGTGAIAVKAVSVDDRPTAAETSVESVTDAAARTNHAGANSGGYGAHNTGMNRGYSAGSGMNYGTGMKAFESDMHRGGYGHNIGMNRGNYGGQSGMHYGGQSGAQGQTGTQSYGGSGMNYGGGQAGMQGQYGNYGGQTGAQGQYGNYGGQTGTQSQYETQSYGGSGFSGTYQSGAGTLVMNDENVKEIVAQLLRYIEKEDAEERAMRGHGNAGFGGGNTGGLNNGMNRGGSNMSGQGGSDRGGLARGGNTGMNTANRGGNIGGMNTAGGNRGNVTGGAGNTQRSGMHNTNRNTNYMATNGMSIDDADMSVAGGANRSYSRSGAGMSGQNTYGGMNRGSGAQNHMGYNTRNSSGFNTRGDNAQNYMRNSANNNYMTTRHNTANEGGNQGMTGRNLRYDNNDMDNITRSIENWRRGGNASTERSKVILLAEIVPVE